VRKRFETAHAVFHYTGSIFIVLGAVMLIPLVCVPLCGEYRSGHPTVLAFAISAALSLVIGAAMRMLFREGPIRTVQAMLICCVGWIGCSALGAFPYVIGLGTGYLDALFETACGFTTTGMTIFTGLAHFPKSILLWRAMTQWFGGIGILAFVLAIGVRGMGAHTLFGAESHKVETTRPVPGLFNTVRILWVIYTGFTGAVFVALMLAGMGTFDAVCHGMTTLATGGFSNYDANIDYFRIAGGYRHVLIEYIIIAGMLAGGISFIVHYRVLTGKPRRLWAGVEMRWFWGIIAGSCLIILAGHYIGGDTPPGPPFSAPFWTRVESDARTALFQTVALVTSTGYHTREISSSWFGPAARQVFLLLMFIGGCAGSTSGGFKVFRVVLLERVIRREIFRLRAPIGAVTRIVIDGEMISVDEVQRVTGLFFAWIAFIAAGGIATALFSRHGAYESISGMFSVVNNIGPSYIPMGDIPSLPPLVKIVWIFGMIAGRLEILPALLLLSPRAWRN